MAAVFGEPVLAAGLEAFDLAILLVGCAPAFLAGKEPPNMVGASWVVKGRPGDVLPLLDLMKMSPGREAGAALARMETLTMSRKERQRVGIPVCVKADELKLVEAAKVLGPTGAQSSAA